MRVIVCGGRDYNDPDHVFRVLTGIGPTEVIEGGASGADAFAKAWALQRGVQIRTVFADWQKHGRAAGPIRNGEMLKLNPDAVVAFPGGRGTADMVRQAKAAGIKVIAAAPKLAGEE
jgi:hypothetical protein